MNRWKSILISLILIPSSLCMPQQAEQSPREAKERANRLTPADPRIAAAELLFGWGAWAWVMKIWHSAHRREALPKIATAQRLISELIPGDDPQQHSCMEECVPRTLARYLRLNFEHVFSRCALEECGFDIHFVAQILPRIHGLDTQYRNEAERAADSAEGGAQGAQRPENTADRPYRSFKSSETPSSEHSLAESILAGFRKPSSLGLNRLMKDVRDHRGPPSLKGGVMMGAPAIIR